MAPLLTRLRPALLLLAVLLVSACGGGRTPEADATRRIWRGPSATVASEGITTYDRREIAQKVVYPTCIIAGPASFRFGEVSRTNTSFAVPPGLYESGYFLDRWRLLVTSGAPESQQKLYVTALGATGIIAEYPRLPDGATCRP